MAEMGEMGVEDCQAPLDHQETKDAEENWGHLDHRERGGYQEHRDHREYLAPRELETKVIMETLACQDLKENREYLAPRGLLETKVIVETLACQDLKENREYLAPRGLLETKAIVETLAWQDLKENRESRAHQQEEQCMFAGGGPLVPLTRELNYYTLEELEGVIIIIKEEVLTISVCHRILITCSIPVESRDAALYTD